MTVESVGNFLMSAGPEDGVACVWFEKGKRETCVFEAVVLETAPKG